MVYRIKDDPAGAEAGAAVPQDIAATKSRKQAQERDRLPGTGPFQRTAHPSGSLAPSLDSGTSRTAVLIAISP
jgi:hypothetical protein